MIPKDYAEKFTLRTCTSFHDFIGIRPRYKVSQRVKYVNVDNENHSHSGKVYSAQIKKIEFIQLRKKNDISYKLRYSTGRRWIDEGQIIDYD